MQEILRGMTKINGVRGVLVVGVDGLTIASEMADDADTNVLAATISSVLVSLNSVLERLDQGELGRLLLNGTEGSVVLQPVGQGILVTLVQKGANMGMILVEIKQCAQSLEPLLGH